jgi:anti-repressor protein
METLKKRDERVKALENKVAEQAPMVEFTEAVITSTNSVKVGEYAKMLSNQSGISIKPNKLFEWFRDNGYLMTGRDANEKNKPYQKYVEKGLFEIKYELRGFTKFSVTYITGKGQFELSKIIVEYFSED